MREVLDLGEQALANGFLAEADLGRPEARYPLRVVCCEACLLWQLESVVDPAVMFSHYRFRTGGTPSLRAHLKGLAETFGGRGRFVVEVGSNDGALLREFERTGAEVLGYEPAANLAALAQAEGLRTVVRFFGPGAHEGPRADVVVARNVVAHCPDLNGFVRAVQETLKPDGVLVVEAPWVLNVFEGDGWAQCYHEHAWTLGVAGMRNLVAAHGMVVADARFVGLHGGSLQYAVRNVGTESETVKRMEGREWEAGCYREEGWVEFRQRAAGGAEGLRTLLQGWKGAGRRYGGYCASAKGSVMLQAAGVGPELLPWIADTTPEKWGTYTPGTRVPVVHPEEVRRRAPEVLLVLAPNWVEEVVADPTIRAGLVTPDGRVWR